MTEFFYNIFGDATRNATKGPTVYNNENIGERAGKSALDGPVKPQEPTKSTGATKKSFLANAGLALQSTPVHHTQVLTAPTPIYKDADSPHDWFEELEFTRPPYKSKNYHIDIFEDSFELGTKLGTPQHSPPPKIKDRIEFESSCEDDFFSDNIILDMSLVHEEDDLPKIY